MSKVRITLDLEEVKALNNILYSPMGIDSDPNSPLYVSPEMVKKFKRFLCHAENLLEFESHNNLIPCVEVVD